MTNAEGDARLPSRRTPPPAARPAPGLSTPASSATSGGSTAWNPDESASDASSRHALREDRAAQLRRALLLTGCSTVIPGLGLLATKRRQLGWALLATAVVIAGVLLYQLRDGAIQGAARLLTSQGLWMLLIMIILGGITWLASVALTYRETAGRGWSDNARLIHRIFAVVMALVVIAPTVEAARYVVVTQDAFGKIFTGRYSGRGATGVTPGTSGDPWKNVGRVNTLLIGSDAGPDRTGVRTDSLMVASVDTKTGDTNLISIPRNFERVPFPASNPLHKVYPNGFYCPTKGAGHDCLMDAVWVEADVNHRDLFPEDEANPGLDTTREVVSEITGLKIDYTTVIDLSGFQQLVDAMGGVYINVPAGGIAIGGRVVNGAIVPGSITGRIPEGYHKLNGYQALWYSRSRVENSDDDRMRRQRCMVNALISQTNPISMITKFPAVMSVAKNNITIDIPQDDLPAIATLVTRMKDGNLRTVNISDHQNHTNPDYPAIRALITKALAQPHDSKGSTPAKSTSASPSPSASTPTATASPTTSANPITDTAASC